MTCRATSGKARMRYDLDHAPVSGVLPQQAPEQLKDVLPFDDQVVKGPRLNAHVQGQTQRL